jgi:hypothetical protein
MADIANVSWFACLPRCETRIPCGSSRHEIHWEAGAIRLPEHPDIAGEQVLAAFAGAQVKCVQLADAWERHSADLSVLAIGPRSHANEISVDWEDVEAAADAGQPGPGFAKPARLTAAFRVGAGRQAHGAILKARLRRNDLLALLALGYRFQVRLIGQVVAAHTESRDARHEPALTAAMEARLALVAEEWLGIDPDRVTVSLHEGPGWGSAKLAGYGASRQLQVSLPAAWLAQVWAAGLALVSRHLVVAVDESGWPEARVLGLPAPGMEPVPLDVHACGNEGANATGDAPHWEV